MTRTSRHARTAIARSMPSSRPWRPRRRHEHERSRAKHLDDRLHRGLQDRHVAVRVAAAHPRPVAVPRRLPGGRRHRGMDRPCPRARLSRRVGDPDATQPIPRGRRAHLPPSVRSRLQSRQLRRCAGHLPARTPCRRSGARGGLDVCADRDSTRGTDRDRRRRTVRTLGCVPPAPPRLRGHVVRILRGAGRPDALRHSVVSTRALRARRRDRAHRGARHRCALRRIVGDLRRFRAPAQGVRRRVPRHRRPPPEAPAAARLHAALGDGRCRLPGAGECRRPARAGQARGRDRRRQRRARRRAQRAARRARSHDSRARERGCRCRRSARKSPRRWRKASRSSTAPC